MEIFENADDEVNDDSVACGDFGVSDSEPTLTIVLVFDEVIFDAVDMMWQ